MAAIDWYAEFEKVGRSLRLGMEAQGCAALVHCIDQLMSHLSDFSPEVAVRLPALLEPALAAQGRKDYLLVADLLEYELAPLLQQSLTEQK